MSGKLKGTIYVLICIALWALIPVVSKTGQTRLDNHQFLFWSSLISFLVLSGTAGLRGKFTDFKRISLREYLGIFVLGLLGTYIYYLFLYLGYAEAVGLEVLVVQYTWPLLIVILSLLILRERLNIRKIVSVILGFSGVVLVITRGDFTGIHVSNPRVILLVLAGAFCFALFSVLSKNVGHDALVVNSLYFLAALGASFISMMILSDFALPTKGEILPVILNGVLVNGFSYLFWIVALQSTEASYLAPFTFITPALSALYLILFFNEPVHWSTFAGLAAVIIGGLINSIRIKKFSQIARFP